MFINHVLRSFSFRRLIAETDSLNMMIVLEGRGNLEIQSSVDGRRKGNWVFFLVFTETDCPFRFLGCENLVSSVDGALEKLSTESDFFFDLVDIERPTIAAHVVEDGWGVKLYTVHRRLKIYCSKIKE